MANGQQFFRGRRVAGLSGASLFVMVTVLWLAALVAAPYAAVHAGRRSPAYVAATGVYVVGSVICHQQARRSFHLDTVQLPVCARCLGIYAAAPVGAWLGLLLARRRRSPWPVDGQDRRWRAWLIAAAAPTVVTVVTEWGSGVMTPGSLRFAAGLPIGFIVAWFITVTLHAGRAAAARRSRLARAQASAARERSGGRGPASERVSGAGGTQSPG